MIKKLFFVFILTGLLLSGCKHHPKDDDTGTFVISDSLASTISFDTVRQSNVADQLQLVGEVSFNQDRVTRVYPNTSGLAQDIKVSLGDYVQKGQVLLTLRSPDIAGAQGDLSAAISDSVSAKKNLDATQDLFTNGLASEPDLINSKSGFQKAMAQLKKVRTQLSISNGEGADALATVRAPESGFLLEKKINEGMFMRADNSDNIFSIGDLSAVWVLANVYESDIEKIKLGVEAEVTTLSFPNKVFKGKVDKIASLLDPETKVMKIRIQLNNSEHLLRPGMFAHIILHFPENAKMLSLNSTTTVFDDNKFYVVRYRNKSDVSMQKIDVFKTFAGTTYFTSDSVNLGDMVIDDNVLFVFNALKKF